MVASLRATPENILAVPFNSTVCPYLYSSFIGKKSSSNFGRLYSSTWKYL